MNCSFCGNYTEKIEDCVGGLPFCSELCQIQGNPDLMKTAGKKKSNTKARKQPKKPISKGFEGWPIDVKYFNGLCWFERDRIHMLDYSDVEDGSNSEEVLEIFDVPIESPAYPGKGIRAKVFIPKGTTIGYYGGYYRQDGIAECDNKAAAYVLRPKYAPSGMIIDAGTGGNLLRMINDPHGSGFEANVETLAQELTIDEKFAVWTAAFVTKKDVLSGEELFFSYGKTFFDYEDGEKMDDNVKDHLHFSSLYRSMFSAIARDNIIVNRDNFVIQSKTGRNTFVKFAYLSFNDVKCKLQLATFGTDIRFQITCNGDNVSAYVFEFNVAKSEFLSGYATPTGPFMKGRTVFNGQPEKIITIEINNRNHFAQLTSGGKTETFGSLLNMYKHWALTIFLGGNSKIKIL